jgi:diadenosine tetraphosphate (Ap4A) HIT family hydrolase
VEQLHDTDCSFCRRIRSRADQSSDLVCEFPHSIVLLGAWQYYEGYCIAICRHHVRELFELDKLVRHAFIDEIALLGEVLASVFKPRKLNVEMLGNQVPHLHCHLFPRSAHDPDHLKPVWVAIDRAEAAEEERRRLTGAKADRGSLRERIRAELSRRTP